MITVRPHPKITPLHLQRKAIVYLRQSSDRQVHRHTESQRLQYALAERPGRSVLCRLISSTPISDTVRRLGPGDAQALNA